MEKIGMNPEFLKRLFRIQDVRFLLSSAALACLPIALINLLHGTDLSLLLPITLFGMFIAQGLSTSNVKKISVGIILLGLGPLALIIHIGGIWESLLGTIKGSFTFITSLFKLLHSQSPVNFLSLLMAREDLIQKCLGLGNRFVLWFLGFWNGIEIEDPVIRTLIWCLVLWMVAAWAGWQMYRQKRLFIGVFPTTLILAFIINSTGKEIEILWLHLGLLIFLLGLTGFAEQKKHWELSKTDYSESTSLDTLGVVAALSFILMIFSSFASSISVEDIMKKLHDRNVDTSEAQSVSLGLELVKDNANIAGVTSGLPRSHLITSGPDLSRQLVMTISTGEVPPLPEAGHVSVPRHYWRTLTYQVYTGSGWWNPSAFGEDVASDEKLIDEIPPNYRIVTQSVIFFNEAGDRLYWAGALRSADVPLEVAWLRKAESNPLLYSNMIAALVSTRSYQAESLELNVDARSLRESPGVYPAWVLRQFLSLPDSVPARVHALARDLTASALTPYDRALAIENYLRTFPYSLEVYPPPSGRDVADYFLFDLKQGYCDYYATSMAVLARAAGLPSRLVIGYANGAYDFEHAQYIVTENYAHSWVEIYFADIGWVEFEPTASQTALSYEEKYEATAPMADALPKDQSFWGRFVYFFQSLYTNAWRPVLIISVCGFLWIGFDLFRLNRLAPMQTIQLLYKRLHSLARPVTGHSSRSQTAHAYAFALTQRLSVLKVSPRLQNWLAPAHDEIGQLTELFSRSLFAPLPITHAEAKNAIKIWSCLRWRLILVNILRVGNR
jgi:transglutaminase-like putative cysteine protease